MTEQLHPQSPELNNAQKTQLAELKTHLEGVFGVDALFAYPVKGEPHVLNLTDTLDLCGIHIVKLPVEKAVSMFNNLRVEAPAENTDPRMIALFEQAREKGTAFVMARVAINQEG